MTSAAPNRTRITGVFGLSDFVAVVDTREQLPFALEVHTEEGPIALPQVRGTLPTGDYSVLGYEREIAVERKSLQDLIGCVGRGRERFDAECVRLMTYPSRCIVVEASMAQLSMGGWLGDITVNMAVAAVVGWIEMGIPIVFAGNRGEADLYTARFLFTAARRRWEKAHKAFWKKLAEKSA